MSEHPIPPKLSQVAFVVADIEKASARFARVFGLEPPRIIETDGFEEAKTHYKGKPTEARAKLAFIHLENITLEFIEPIGGPSVWRDFLEANGDSVHHLAVNVENPVAASEALAKEGWADVQDGLFPGGGYRYSAATDEGGLKLDWEVLYQR